jgi:anti-sigma-K factor RskA
VLQRVAATPQLREPARTGAGSKDRPPVLVRSRLWLAAAVLAVITLGSGAFAWSQYRSAEEARTTAQQITSVLADPSARVVGARVGTGGNARLVVAGDRAVLAGGDLPALPPQRAYQLWVIRGSAVRSAGLGPAGSSAAGTWSRLVDDVRPGDTVAVSVEPEGGSAQPTTSPVVALKA